jgi:hypothetical protein
MLRNQSHRRKSGFLAMVFNFVSGGMHDAVAWMDRKSVPQAAAMSRFVALRSTPNKRFLGGVAACMLLLKPT